MDDDDLEIYRINSEIRYIVLELMKMKGNFKENAKKYAKNLKYFKKILEVEK